MELSNRSWALCPYLSVNIPIGMAIKSDKYYDAYYENTYHCAHNIA